MKTWLNHYVSQSGTWNPGEPKLLEFIESLSLGGSSIRLHETATGGQVLLSPVGASLTVSGAPEVYLKIIYSDGTFDWLSAPLGTPVDVHNVDELELRLLCIVGDISANAVRYRALINAHCVYEKIDAPAVDSNLVSGVGGTDRPGQSFNEIRALDVTVLAAYDLSVESMTLDGIRFPASGETRIGARIFRKSSNALVSTSQDVTLPGPFDYQSVTIPVEATLSSGEGYRVGFFVLGSPQSGSSGNLFLPNSLPYVDETGLFRINSTHARGLDAYPNNNNSLAPRVTIRTRRI